MLIVAYCTLALRLFEQEYDVRQQSSQNSGFSQLMVRLDRVSRIMNPLLLFVAVSLVVLNLACVVNLIDWSHLPQSPAESAASVARSSDHVGTGPCTVSPTLMPVRSAGSSPGN